MRFLSVCSGIEAASVAWRPLGWHAAAFAEIEPFPCALLAHHYPDVPNRGDMTKFQDWPDESIDLVCGGTPCQSFSVAGLRAGLDDPRGDLMLTFGAIAAKYRPRWLVWENVPGVLSSNGGRDFGSFLGLLGQLGYGFAYRVLDAQHFGVPQRRRRVFVVGCLGDWRSAAAVLFERHSMSRHPAPSRKARQELARCLTRGSGGGQRYDGDTETFVTHALTGEGFDASEDGTGRGTPLVPVGFAQNQRDEVRVMHVAGALAAEPGAKQQTYIAFDCMASGQNGFGIGEILGGLRVGTGGSGASHAAVAFQSSQSGVREVEAHATLDANDGSRRHNGVVQVMQVRRLTPRECERLQGFPDGYTAIPHRGKPAADGPRYKALGNSWAVPCARWIGERIQAVDGIAR